MIFTKASPHQVLIIIIGFLAVGPALVAPSATPPALVAPAATPPALVGAVTKRQVKFSDNWGADFPQCNQANNEFLSPINIDTKKAKPTNTRTLLTYSYDPIKNYSLHTGYYDKINNVAMSALTIMVDELIFFECTYINGLGFENFQIFDKAVFFFSNSPLRAGQSFHTIDGKTYPMEIMFYFNNKQVKDSEDKKVGVTDVKDTTQVFVLVEFQDEDNQIWFPVIEAARQIMKKKPKKEQMDELNKKLEAAKKDLDKLVSAKTNLSLPVNSTVLKSIQHDIGKLQDTLESDIKRKIGVEKLMAELENETARSEAIKNFDALAPNIVIQRANFQSEVAASAKIRTSGTPMQKERLNKVMETLFDGIRMSSGQMMRFAKEFGPLGKRKQSTQEEIEILIKRIEGVQNRIQKKQDASGFDSTKLDLKNGTVFKKLVKDVIKLEADIKTANNTINKTMEEIKERQESHFWSARMTTFQASWLLPATGGYYAYNSSIPLPPCQRIRYTIVLKNTIKISKKQFNVLASIPAYEGFEPLDHMAAPMRELGERTLWYNKKFLQFQRDDGLHIKSIVRAQMKRDKKSGNLSTPGTAPNIKIEHWNFASIFTIILAVTFYTM